MTNPSKTSSYDGFRGSSDWRSPGLFWAPPGWEKLIKRVKVVNSAEIGINEFVEFVQVAGTDTDLINATVAADNSTTVAAWVIDNEYNKEILCRDNSVDDLSTLTKATAKFLTGSYIDVLLLVPGIILSTKVKASVGASGYKPYTAVQSAGSGAVDGYATASAQLGYLLSQVYDVAAVQWIAMIVQRGY
jgi:hypothetical protein